MVTQQVLLRKTLITDLEYLFQFQLDPVGAHMAAFMPKDAADKSAYIQRYAGYLDDPTKNMRTILVDDVIAGSISKFEMDREAEITYWIDKCFWGKGIASIALKHFLTIETTRPIYARTSFDNVGSQKVLEKSGFVRVGQDAGFATARQAEVEEFIFRLG